LIGLEIARTLVDLYSLVVLAAVVLSWIQLPDENPLVRFTRAATEPLLQPIRRVVPAIGGLDLSAMLLLFALRFLSGLLMTSV
jgi:YggT family protein